MWPLVLHAVFRGIDPPDRFALVRGRAAALWAMPRGEVEISPFGALSVADAAALDAEAADVKRFVRSPASPPRG